MKRGDRPTARYRNGFTVGEAVVVAIIIGVLLAIFLPAIEASRPYRPPTIPKGEPSEEYRVHLPNGFSVVRPPYWEVTSGGDPAGSWSRFVFRAPIGNDPGGLIEVTRYTSEAPRDPRAVQIGFQGRPAWMTTERREPDFVYSRGHFRASIVAPREGCWISIEYAYMGDQSAVPDMMWKYFETIACPAGARPAP